MNKVILDYLNRKLIKKKLTRPIDEYMINSLISLVDTLGVSVFNRSKKILSAKVINETIPCMINYHIFDVYKNLEKIKIVKRNSLDHYKLLYGEKAEEFYKERTNKSLNTKENFIKRHGESVGLTLWIEYVKKKKKQNTLEGFVERYGYDLGKQKFNEYSNRQSYTNTIEYYIEKYGEDLGTLLYKERYPSDYDINEYSSYKKLVYKLSNEVYNKNKHILNPHNYPRTKMGVYNGWQLDHINPVNECFKNGVSPEKAAALENLRMLPWKTNLMRNFK